MRYWGEHEECELRESEDEKADRRATDSFLAKYTNLANLGKLVID